MNLVTKFNNRGKTEKNLIIALALVGATALASIIAASVLGSQVNDRDQEIADLKQIIEERTVCTTPDCLYSAAELLEAMNTDADPCEDFFAFTCGNWTNVHPMPPTKSRWTQFDLIQDDMNALIRSVMEENERADDPKCVKSMRNMYAACVDIGEAETLGVTPIIDILNDTSKYNGWPMAIPDFRESDFKWDTNIAAYRHLYGLNYLVTTYVALDSKNTNRSVVYMDQTSLPLPRPYYLNTTLYANIFEAYKAYITGAANVIGRSARKDDTFTVDNKAVQDVIDFEVKLAQITTPSEERRNNTAMYNLYALSELQDKINLSVPDKFNVENYLNAVFTDVTSFNGSSTVVVVEDKYLEKLVMLLNKTDVITLANYIGWRLVRDMSPETTQKMLDLQFEFNKVLTSVSEPEPRWTRCVNKVNDLLGFAVSKRYVEEAFNPQGKIETEEMVANLLQSFKELVDEASWMDNVTQATAKDKADAIHEFLAYPDWIFNGKFLDTEVYPNLPDVDNKNHFNNMVNIVGYSVLSDLSNLLRPTNREKWITYPSVVNAFYEPTYNSITFPAGILQKPFFKSGRLNALNYGGIGIVIGHEITHGFDDEGRQSDKFGNTASWWTEETLANYNERADCFVGQYSNYTVPEADNVHLNGENTLGENIADNGGIREAFRAYMKYVQANGEEMRLPGLEAYTPEQLFFISYGNIWCGTYTPDGFKYAINSDVHSPNRYRVWGAVSNSEDFARVFNCPANSKMVREDKCVLW